MKTNPHLSKRTLAGAGLAAVLLAAAPLSAQEPANLLANGGFEESVAVAISMANAHYRPLIERNVEIPSGDAAAMPAEVSINPADGWTNEACKFEYVEGKTGAEVHTGKRAVRIESPKTQSAIVIGKNLSVVEGVGLDERAIQVGKPHKFSLYAKGTGTVMVRCYMYDAKLANLYDYSRCQEVKPQQFAVSDEDRWQKLEGTLQIKCPEVNHIVFVIGVQGSVSLDDVVLLPQ